MRGLAQALCTAARLPLETAEMAAVERALADIEARRFPDSLGVHVLPAFLCVGAKS